MGRKSNKFKSQRGSYYLLTGFIGLAMIGSTQFVMNRLSAIKTENVLSAVYTSFEKRPVTVSFAGNPQVSTDFLATLEVAAKESSSKAGSVNVAAQLWMKNVTALGTSYEFVGGIDANSAPTTPGDLTTACSDMISALETNNSSAQPNFIVVAFVPGLDTVCRVTEAGMKEEGSAIIPPPPPNTGGGGPFDPPPSGGGGGGGGTCLTAPSLNSPDTQQMNLMPDVTNCV